LLSACASRPEIRTQAAPQFAITSYHTYAFMARPSTDSAGYKTITTQSIEKAVNREMQARGYRHADTGQTPDLLINFIIKTHDKVESYPGPQVGFGYGWGWGRYGWGGLGPYYNDVRTVTDGSLTIDLVDRASNEAVWSGTAIGRINKKTLDNPGKTLDEAVSDIFAHYPVKPAGEAH
jgi:hypothetical protein